MKQTRWFGPIQIVPIDDPTVEDTRTPEQVNDGVPRGDIKELVLMDPHSGEQVIYTMNDELAVILAKALRMSNKALFYEHKEKADAARAQQLLHPDGNGSGPPEQILRNISRGM